MMKRMTKREYIELVNETARLLHKTQGREGHVLPDSYYDAAVGKLTEHFQRNFMNAKDVEGKPKYIVFPLKPAGEWLNDYIRWDIPVFEVEWFVRALLGIALCRQALVIHREPKGPEPADSDKRLVRLVNQFIRQANPEIINREDEPAEKVEIAAPLPQKAGCSTES